MPRIPEVDPTTTPARVQATLEAQRETYGAPLNNHLLYAHNEDVFRGARAMWSALDKAGLIDPGMAAVLNRRVASRVGCVFWQDINAAVAADHGLTTAQILALADETYDRNLFDERTLAALDYADAITTGHAGSEFVTDELFSRVAAHFTTEEIVVLTELIAWENASARFNRALGVESQQLWSAG